MAESEDEFVFNGINGATGDYLLAPMTAKQIADIAAGKDPDEVQQEAASRHENLDFAPRADVDPKKLEETGWGVIFTQDADPAVREALQPLLDFRQKKAAAEAEHRFQVFDGKRGYKARERKTKFLRRHKAPISGPVDPDKMPYYLLLVGSAEDISPEFQAQLDLQHAVGRLHFETPDQYAQYAHSVIKAETYGIDRPHRLGMFGVENDRATRLSAEGLIAGLDEYVQSKVPEWKEAVDVFREKEATKAQLTRMLGGPDTPAVLFTASHGLGWPKDDKRQLPYQGALLCQDWTPAPEEIPRDAFFAGEDLTKSARLEGLIAFLFACYGGGTPKYDAFYHKKGTRDEIAPHSFFADLPTRMLSHPGGTALAVVAHVERAWGCSFYSSRVGHQIAVFESFMKRLLDGYPIGSAMDFFGERFGELSAGLVDKLEDLENGEDDITETEIANDWTANNDARNYLVLGDPACRVPDVASSKAPDRPSIDAGSTSRSAGKGGLVPTEGAAAPAESEESVAFGLWGKKDKEPEAESGGGAMDSLRGFVSKLGDRISKGLDDMSSLDVRTYVASEMDQVSVEGAEVVGARLRALTRISFDGDTIVCLPERDGEIDEAVLEVHQRMVKQAQDARTELMKTIVQAAASLTGLGKGK